MTYPERIIPFDGLTNFRDFGGYRAGTGRLATGRLFRSASHALATERDLERLAGMGITTVVDLRRPTERERQPSRRWSGFQGLVVENDDQSEGSRAWDTFMSQWDFSQEAYRSFLLDYYAEAPLLPRPALYQPALLIQQFQTCCLHLIRQLYLHPLAGGIGIHAQSDGARLLGAGMKFHLHGGAGRAAPIVGNRNGVETCH